MLWLNWTGPAILCELWLDHIRTRVAHRHIMPFPFNYVAAMQVLTMLASNQEPVIVDPGNTDVSAII